MVSGQCNKCKRKIGGTFAKLPLWQCPTCRKIWCPDCAPKQMGVLFKKRLCPEDLIEMSEGGIKSYR